MTGIRLPPMNCRGFFVTMKKLEFETGKGQFLLVDAIEKPNIHTGIKLSEITEEQASEIVDLFDILPYHYQDYERQACAYNTAIESLHSLIKSKGIHLFKNSVPKPIITKDVILCNYDWELEQWQESEEKTFYNPYIFKL